MLGHFIVIVRLARGFSLGLDLIRSLILGEYCLFGSGGFVLNTGAGFSTRRGTHVLVQGVEFLPIGHLNGRNHLVIVLKHVIFGLRAMF